MSWASLQERLRNSWKPGEHITLVGPTRSGKTHMAVQLASLCRYVLVLATKRRDPLITDLESVGYLVITDLQDVLWTQDKKPVHRKVVYWPEFEDKLPAIERIKRQSVAMGNALDWADRTGGWAILVDETMWLTRRLKLERNLESLWFQGRTQGISVIACAQRPAHVPRLAFSSADYLFLWQTGDRRDVENLREISGGVSMAMIERNVRALDFDKHEALFIDTHNRDMARVIAPAL